MVNESLSRNSHGCKGYNAELYLFGYCGGDINKMFKRKTENSVNEKRQSFCIETSTNIYTYEVKKWASLVAQIVKNLECRRPGFNPRVGMITWQREWLPTPVFWPGEVHGLCSLWCNKESDATFTFTFYFPAFPIFLSYLFSPRGKPKINRKGGLKDIN